MTIKECFYRNVFKLVRSFFLRKYRGGLGETAFISWRGPDDLAFKKALGTSARSTGPLHDKNAVLPSAPLFVLIIRNHTSQGSFFSNPGLYSITNKLHVQQVHFKQDLHNLRKYLYRVKEF